MFRKTFLIWLAAMVVFIITARVVVAYCPSCVCYDCIKWVGERGE